MSPRPRPSDMEAILRQTLEDRALSRGERRALKSVLEEKAFDGAQLAKLQSLVFEIAAEAMSEPRDREVLGWVADTVKLIAPRGEREPDAAPGKVWFTPEDDGATKIAELIRSARESIDVCVFTITDNRITRALIDAYRGGAGARIRILTDDDKAADLGSDIRELARAGIRVACDDTEAHMHHKFALFDRRLLLTGSYNWTRSANTVNHENFLVTGDPVLVTAYAREFERLFERFG